MNWTAIEFVTVRGEDGSCAAAWMLHNAKVTVVVKVSAMFAVVGAVLLDIRSRRH